MWSDSLLEDFLPVDKVGKDEGFPTREWAFSHYRAKTTSSVEFKKRIQLWGKPLLEYYWREWLRENKDVANAKDQDVAKGE